MKKTDRPYLFTTKDGWYSYYRRIPKKILHLVEFDEFSTFYKKALDTKDRTLAEMETDKKDEWFSMLLGNTVKPKLTTERLRKAKDHLRKQDLLQQQISPDELLLYYEDVQAEGEYWKKVAEAEAKHKDSWEETTIEIEEPEYKSQAFIKNQKREVYLEALRNVVDDMRDDGQGGYKRLDPYDDNVIRLKIMEGGLDVELEPTFGDAVETYITDYGENKHTNEDQRSHYIGQIKSISNKIAEGLEKGLNTPLAELDPIEIKAIAEKVWPNANTRKTNLSNRMVPVINTWNKKNRKKQLLSNPFQDLVGDRAVKRDTKTKRSMTPEEYNIFWDNCVAHPEPEIRMIGLMIAYCGCPQKETAGMLRGDLKLQTNVPYLLIRNHPHRLIKGASRLERCIPLVDPILPFWKDYIENHFQGKNTDLLFPKFGVGKYQVQKRSKQMSPLVKNIQGGEDILSSYSARHTMKERYQAARVGEGVGSYLFGHRNKLSSKVHEDYGGMENPHLFLEDMTKIANVKDFGFIELFDEV